MPGLDELRLKRRPTGQRRQIAKERRKREKRLKFKRPKRQTAKQKAAVRKMKSRGVYKKIAALRSSLALPTTVVGTVSHRPEYVDLILEASVAFSVDAQEFAKLFLGKPAAVSNTDTGMAAVQFEAWLYEHGHEVVDRFLETQVGGQDTTFLAIFRGKVESEELEKLRTGVADICTLEAVLKAGAVNHEEGTISDMTIFECNPTHRPKTTASTTPAAAAPRTEGLPRTKADYEAVIQEGGLSDAAYRFLYPDGDPHRATWYEAGGVWLPDPSSLDEAKARKYAVRTEKGKKADVLKLIRKRDKTAKVDPEGNPTTAWVTTKLSVSDLEHMTGVEDVVLSSSQKEDLDEVNMHGLTLEKIKMSGEHQAFKVLKGKSLVGFLMQTGKNTADEEHPWKAFGVSRGKVGPKIGFYYKRDGGQSAAMRAIAKGIGESLDEAGKDWSKVPAKELRKFAGNARPSMGRSQKSYDAGFKDGKAGRKLAEPLDRYYVLGYKQAKGTGEDLEEAWMLTTKVKAHGKTYAKGKTVTIVKKTKQGYQVELEPGVLTHVLAKEIKKFTSKAPNESLTEGYVATFSTPLRAQRFALEIRPYARTIRPDTNQVYYEPRPQDEQEDKKRKKAIHKAKDEGKEPPKPLPVYSDEIDERRKAHGGVKTIEGVANFKGKKATTRTVKCPSCKGKVLAATGYCTKCKKKTVTEDLDEVEVTNEGPIVYLILAKGFFGRELGKAKAALEKNPHVNYVRPRSGKGYSELLVNVEATTPRAAKNFVQSQLKKLKIATESVEPVEEAKKPPRGALYVAYSSIFDSPTNKYDIKKFTAVLKKAGAKRVWSEPAYGWSNQPDVVLFTGLSEEDASAALSKLPVFKKGGPIIHDARRDWTESLEEAKRFKTAEDVRDHFWGKPKGYKVKIAGHMVTVTSPGTQGKGMVAITWSGKKKSKGPSMVSDFLDAVDPNQKKFPSKMGYGESEDTLQSNYNSWAITGTDKVHITVGSKEYQTDISLVEAKELLDKIHEYYEDLPHEYDMMCEAFLKEYCAEKYADTQKTAQAAPSEQGGSHESVTERDLKIKANARMRLLGTTPKGGTPDPFDEAKKVSEPKLLKACAGNYGLYNIIRSLKLIRASGNETTAKVVEQKSAKPLAKKLGVLYKKAYAAARELTHTELHTHESAQGSAEVLARFHLEFETEDEAAEALKGLRATSSITAVKQSGKQVTAVADIQGESTGAPMSSDELCTWIEKFMSGALDTPFEFEETTDEATAGAMTMTYQGRKLVEPTMLKSLAKKAGVDLKTALKRWGQAQLAAEKSYPDVKKKSPRYYSIVVGILKKMLGLSKGESVEVGPIIAQLKCRACGELFQEVLELDTVATCPKCESYSVEPTGKHAPLEGHQETVKVSTELLKLAETTPFKTSVSTTLCNAYRRSENPTIEGYEDLDEAMSVGFKKLGIKSTLDIGKKYGEKLRAVIKDNKLGRYIGYAVDKSQAHGKGMRIDIIGTKGILTVDANWKPTRARAIWEDYPDEARMGLDPRGKKLVTALRSWAKKNQFRALAGTLRQAVPRNAFVWVARVPAEMTELLSRRRDQLKQAAKLGTDDIPVVTEEKPEGNEVAFYVKLRAMNKIVRFYSSEEPADTATGLDESKTKDSAQALLDQSLKAHQKGKGTPEDMGYRAYLHAVIGGTPTAHLLKIKGKLGKGALKARQDLIDKGVGV